jgi:hypothetical protein
MASAFVVALVKFGLLALIWLFVVAAVRVVRTDIGARGGRTPVVAAPAAAPAAPARSRSAARRLVVTDGALAGTTLALDDAPVTLGRADDSTLVLSDDYASTHHARLVPGDGAWLIEDLGSTNGTFLDGNRLTRPTPVPLGHEIRIGRTALELRR